MKRSPRNLNEENTFNHRTSTPLCSSCHQQIDNTLGKGYNDSFPMDSIPPET